MKKIMWIPIVGMYWVIVANQSSKQQSIVIAFHSVCCFIVGHFLLSKLF